MPNLRANFENTSGGKWKVYPELAICGAKNSVIELILSFFPISEVNKGAACLVDFIIRWCLNVKKKYKIKKNINKIKGNMIMKHEEPQFC